MAHERVRQLSAEGRHAEAVAVAMGPGAAAFDGLDGTLARAAAGEQRAFQRDIEQSRRALGGLVAGTILLAVAAAACVSWGIAKRLEDYR